MLASEAQINLAVIRARPVEGELRKVVASDLLRAYGPEWRNRLPDPLLIQWGNLREKEIEAGIDRGPEIIEYATLSEILDLINREWEIFSHRFENGKGYNELDEFRILRNRLMHSSQSAAKDCERAIELAGWITICCNQQVELVRKGVEKDRSDGQEIAEPRLGEQRKRFYDLIVSELKGMSGTMPAEREALTDFLKKHMQYTSFPLLEAVRSHFSALDDTEQVINQLGKYVPPKRPMPIGKAQKLNDWLKWADRHYLPYRRWMIAVDQADEEIEALGLAYEDWLRVNYPQILLEGSPQLLMNVYQEIRKQIENKFSVFWLVIDNLAAYWVPAFHSALEEASFGLEHSQRMLAMLPSVTDISRRSMFAGRLPKDALLDYSDDGAAFRDLWKQESDLRPKFCSTVEEARSGVESGSRFIALVFNRLDQRIHRPDDGWFSSEEDINNDLGRMFEKVSGLVRKMNNLHPTKLVVSTDHGCIKPSPSSGVLDLPLSAIPDEDFPFHRRHAAAGDIAGVNEIDWHILGAEDFQLPKTYVVARGQRFIGGRPRGYAHGGLSPEETVVHFYVATPGLREDQQLSFFYTGDAIRLGQEQPISILVSNPFSLDVDQVAIQIQHMDIEFPPLDLESISQRETEPQPLTLPLDSDVRDEKVILPLIYEYTIGGRLQSASADLTIAVSTLYSSEELEDFEGLFDE